MASANAIVPGGEATNRNIANIGASLPAKVDRIDLSGSVSFLRRRFRLILAVVIATLLLGGAISAFQQRKFTAEATVSLAAPAHPNAAVATNNGVTSPNSAYVDTQVEIIQSREMATRVAESLGLLDQASDADRRDNIDDLQANIEAERSGESYALTLVYEGDSGEQASQRVNEFARQFADWELRSTRENNSESIGILRERLAELRSQAQSDMEVLQRYRIENNLLSTSGASLVEQEISSYNQTVTQARAEAAEAQARLQTALAQIRSGSSGDDVGEALNSAVISSLRNRESVVAGQVANLSARYGENHPELIRANSELEEIRRQIDAEIGRVISNLQAQANVSQQRLASLTSSLNSARSQLSQNNAAMVGLNELERAAEVSQGLYETYLANYQQLVAGEGAEQPNARVISFSEIPLLPSSPNIILNLVVSLVIGMGLGVIAAYVADGLFKGVSAPDEIESELGVRYFGAIPLLQSVCPSEASGVSAIDHEPRSAFAEAFRALVTSVSQESRGTAKVVALTSALPREGKTIASICLAQTYAAAGTKTVLVDCDQTRRGVSSLLDLPADRPGLIEVLNGDVPLHEATIHSSDGLSVLPLRAAASHSDAILAGPYMDELLRGLCSEFDCVVLDLPPVLPVAVARTLASKADSTLMIVRWRKTPLQALRAALRQMGPEKVRNLGVVMSQVDMRKSGFLSQSDPNFYYSEYRSYYQ